MAKTSEDDTQDSDTVYTAIPEANTTPDDKILEQNNGISVSCATASSKTPHELDIENETWKESWRFANQITYSLRSQIARGYLEEKIYHEQLYKDIIALRELESKAWEEGGKNSKGGNYWHGERRDDDGWIEGLQDERGESGSGVRICKMGDRRLCL